MGIERMIVDRYVVTNSSISPRKSFYSHGLVVKLDGVDIHLAGQIYLMIYITLGESVIEEFARKILDLYKAAISVFEDSFTQIDLNNFSFFLTSSISEAILEPLNKNTGSGKLKDTLFSMLSDVGMILGKMHGAFKSGIPFLIRSKYDVLVVFRHVILKTDADRVDDESINRYDYVYDVSDHLLKILAGTLSCFSVTGDIIEVGTGRLDIEAICSIIKWVKYLGDSGLISKDSPNFRAAKLVAKAVIDAVTYGGGRKITGDKIRLIFELARGGVKLNYNKTLFSLDERELGLIRDLFLDHHRSGNHVFFGDVEKPVHAKYFVIIYKVSESYGVEAAIMPNIELRKSDYINIINLVKNPENEPCNVIKMSYEFSDLPEKIINRLLKAMPELAMVFY